VGVGGHSDVSGQGQVWCDRLATHVNAENPAAITKVHKRRNYVIRKSTNLSRQSHIIAANLDRAFLVVTIDFPQVKLPFLDRLLVTCEVYNVPPVIVLNKCDLYGPEHEDMLAAFHEIYEGAGYPIIDVSARTGQGIDLLRDVVSGKRLPDGSLDAAYDPAKPAVSLFSGVSGVGKSSLIKALDPSLEPRVGDISTAHEQGRHTTTFYEMYRVSSCHPERSEGSVGFIVDTPGLRGFGLVDLKKEEIALYFPEMLEAAQNCRFTPCTHTHEPGCAVKEAVEEGLISYDRYSSYLGMLDEEGKYR
jgi:ribosome biogenesis GTPase